MSIEATPEELKWIADFKNLAKRCPKSLWLYSASSTLYVMQKNKEGMQAERYKGTAIDPDYILTDIDIMNDGGDW